MLASILPCVLVAALLPRGASAAEPVIALKNVRIESPGAAAVDGANVVLADGVIRAAGAGVEIPWDAEVIDCTGLTLVPAFIDAWSTAVTRAKSDAKDEKKPAREVDEGVHWGMDAKNRNGLAPEREVEIDLAKDGVKAWRESGFGAVLAVPDGTGFHGDSAAVLLRSDATPVADALLARDVMAHCQLRTDGAGYPSTLMGTLSHDRQFLSDARALREEWQRYDRMHHKVARPPLDAALEATFPLLDGKRRLALEATDRFSIRSALRFAAEFGLSPVLAGAGEADEMIGEIQAAKAPVLLGVDFPKPADEESADGPRDAHDSAVWDESQDERDDCDRAGLPPEWTEAQDPPVSPAAPAKPAVAGDKPADAPEMKPADKGDAPDAKGEGEKKKPKKKPDLPKRVIDDRNARRDARIATASKLAAAGVPFAITSRGLKTGAEVRKNVALAVEKGGLSRDAALAALTASPAALLGVGDVLGKVEPGMSATVAVFTTDPLKADSSVRFLFVGGEKFEFKVKPKSERKGDGRGPQANPTAIDVTGTWIANVELDSGAKSYTLAFTQTENKLAGNAQGRAGAGEISGGSVSGDTIDFTTVFEFGDRHYEFVYHGKVAGGSMSGTVAINGGQGYPFSAERQATPNEGSR